MEDSAPTPIIVWDFNRYAVRSACARAAKRGQSQRSNWSEQLLNGNRMTLKMEDSVLLAGCRVSVRVRLETGRNERTSARNTNAQAIPIENATPTPDTPHCTASSRLRLVLAMQIINL